MLPLAEQVNEGLQGQQLLLRAGARTVRPALRQKLEEPEPMNRGKRRLHRAEGTEGSAGDGGTPTPRAASQVPGIVRTTAGEGAAVGPRVALCGVDIRTCHRDFRAVRKAATETALGGLSPLAPPPPQAPPRSEGRLRWPRPPGLRSQASKSSA
ncbi:hypothetical protein TREES_T100007542 [Tupaia chinensis]|uniref:Uncharacterized protein n=1 Tax=Tupaia chinensis TaxID=246437 RepID=L9KV85_TUPCH|nr:hypothetical protein TREES_T100007542 [Tupaia chinensis]